MKVLLVDDHPLFIDGLKHLLTSRGVEVVGTARDGLEAIEKTRALHPEVVLMDIHMPRLDGLGALHLIKMDFPEVRVVMLTMSDTDDHLFNAIRNGACGYLLKTLDTEEFFVQLQELARGEVPLSAGLAARLLQEFGRLSGSDQAQATDVSIESLTPRQLEILTLVAQGLTYKEVGAQLCLSERTVKYHMGEIVRRLHLKGRAQIMAQARQMGLVKPDTPSHVTSQSS
jgi:two-component system NarL family response regulator